MSLRTALNFIIYSNIWISCGAVSFSALYFEFFGLEQSIPFLGFVFCATLFTYNFQRLVKLEYAVQSFSGFGLNWIKQHKAQAIGLTIAAFLGGLILGYPYLAEGWKVLAAIAFVSFFYIWKLPGLSINLRNVPTLKIYLVAITWTLTSSVLPHVLFGDQSFTWLFLIFMGSQFCFIVAITIPFDIRDMDKDESTKRTIPQLIGIRRSKALAIMLILLSYIGFSAVYGQPLIGVGINSAFAILLLAKTHLDRKDQYYTGLIDGLLVSLLLLFFVK